jgi:2-C-methyl-D-erythritol 2,4-cyclodiphosphate synthase
VDSRVLLQTVVSKLTQQGWLVGNVDVTVVAQTPRLSEHIGSMQAHIASDLGVDVSAVNVKATTTERLGFEGRSEGIASYAVALIVQGGDEA